MNEYYRILGLKYGASDKEIKDAYRKLAKKYHPDVYKGNDGDTKMKEINEAYNKLTSKKTTKSSNTSNYYYNPYERRYETTNKYYISTNPIITYAFIDYTELMDKHNKPINENLKFTYEYQSIITSPPEKEESELIFDKNIFNEKKDPYLIKMYTYDNGNFYNMEIVYLYEKLGSRGFANSWAIGDITTVVPLHVSLTINNIPKTIEFNFNKGNIIQHINIGLIDIINGEIEFTNIFNKKIKVFFNNIKEFKSAILIKISDNGLPVKTRNISLKGNYNIKLHTLIKNDLNLSPEDKVKINDILSKSTKKE